MFTSIKGPYGVIGVAMALIALFLLLDNSKGAGTLADKAINGADKLARTLQGR